MDERYSRQKQLDVFGKVGQVRISKSKVLIIGCGGLGGPVAVYLASAGVGQITLMDGDNVEKSNLPRQVFFKSDDSGNKAKLIKEYIISINPSIQVKAIQEFLTKENAEYLNENYDVVVDGTDDWMTKFLISDYCCIHQIPLSFAALYKTEGCLTFFTHETLDDITLRDIYADPSAQVKNCAEIGVMNTIVGLIANLQANDVLKYLLGLQSVLSGRMVWYNGISNQQNIIKLKKNYTNDLKSIFAEELYLSIYCKIQEIEISYSDLIKTKNLTLISVLEVDEHVFIEGFDVIHKPMSKFPAASYDLARGEDNLVFYCYSGVRSSTLAFELKEKYPHKNILSLASGVKQFDTKS